MELPVIWETGRIWTVRARRMIWYRPLRRPASRWCCSCSTAAPIRSECVSGKVAAILECWYLGQETGTCRGRCPVRRVQPGGKLPISIPRSAGHLPCFYNHKPSARRGYLFDDISPPVSVRLRPELHDIRIRGIRGWKLVDRVGESTDVSWMSKTPAHVTGEEVVQMYIRDVVSSVTRPVKELKGFAKISLKPGESRTVSLPVGPSISPSRTLTRCMESSRAILRS